MLSLSCSQLFVRPGEADVIQQIRDINDNPPVFTNLPKNISIKEDTSVGSLVFTVSATDADSSPANAFVFAIETGNEEGRFEFPDSSDNEIKLKKSLDYDDGTKQFVLRIIAKNTLSTPNLNSTAVLTINVEDVDDLGAKFEKNLYEATLVKDSLPGTVVTTVQAKDRDSLNATVEFKIYQETNPGNVYKVNNNTGEITVNGPLTIGTQLLVVTATSTKHPPAFTVVNITVASMLKMSYTVTVAEGLSNVVILNLEPVEQYYNVIGGTFSIIPSAQSSLFSIDGKNLKVGGAALDRETRDQYQLNIVVDKDGTRKGVVMVTVKVLDVNDNTPQFVGSLPYSVSISSNRNLCSIFFKVSATDRDAGSNGTVRYSITSGNNEGLFSIDSLTGQVSLKLPLDRASKDQYVLIIKASDGGNPQMANSTTLIINVKDLNNNDLGAAPTNCGETFECDSKHNGISAFSNIALEERHKEELGAFSHTTDEQNVIPAPKEQSDAPGPASVTQQPSMDTDYELPDRQSLKTNQPTPAPHTYQALNVTSPGDQSTLCHAYEPLHFGDSSS
ncbi:cadherin EGF LAG seven-pass G-type receptor 2-like [Actinia tenebrosa]|uniref:Cadherin EGF LAG seven-pass G-type receptor 2-like n=1 Tax=Actinia tenebrosa TaxID=6105 RepID=A0A6P8H084_ACTTE|nr:cadherin EGF LAG seven-pass G-type receptor 2-like [Actinia tenebrosa]